MRVIIVDDEKPVLELMKTVVSKNKNLDIVGEFTNPCEALKEISNLLPDVIFIDIEMPYMNGIELAKQVEKLEENIAIVFVTAYENYALEAFKVNVVNYILKPISEEDIDITVTRLLRNRNRLNEEISKDNRIYCLGIFKVYEKSGNEIIKWSTSKVQEIFAYFIYKGVEGIDKWSLCEVLWKDASAKKAEQNLHSTIHRLKAVFKKVGIENVINYKNGRYMFDFKNFSCDLWEFRKFIESNPMVSSENIKDFQRILDLYKGNLFEDKDYTWAVDLRENINRYYIQGVKSVAKYYIDAKEYNKAYNCLNKGIKINPFDEDSHELIMSVYCYLGDRVGLIAHYNRMAALFKEELYIPIKESTKNLYEKLISKL